PYKGQLHHIHAVFFLFRRCRTFLPVPAAAGFLPDGGSASGTCRPPLPVLSAGKAASSSISLPEIFSSVFVLFPIHDKLLKKMALFDSLLPGVILFPCKTHRARRPFCHFLCPASQCRKRRYGAYASSACHPYLRPQRYLLIENNRHTGLNVIVNFIRRIIGKIHTAVGTVVHVNISSERRSPCGVVKALSVKEGHPVGHFRSPAVGRVASRQHGGTFLVGQRERA